MSFRRRALFLAGLFVAVSCSDAGNPVAPEGPEPGAGDAPVSMVQSFICKVDAVGGTDTCEPEGPAMGGVPGAISLRSAAYAEVLATTVASPADSTYRETRFVNLIPQALGTTDGTTPHPYGIRVWIEPPFDIDTIVAGQPTSVTVANEYGTMTWNSTYANRPYFLYQEVVQPGDTSSMQTFRFAKQNVSGFQYKIAIATEVQFPKGWINITPDNPTVDSGSVDTLVARVRGAYGQVHSEAAGLTWTSTDPSVVSVLELTPKDTLAQITAHKEGEAWIKVWSSTVADASARRDSVLVTVNSAPVVLQDTSAAVTNVTVARPAGRLLEKASDPSDETLSVVADSVTSARGGTVIIAANGGFTYLSAADSSGTDSFQFQVTDGVRTTTGTMVVNVLPSSYWYVRAGAGGGDGRDRRPFGSVGDAQAKAGANDTIIVLPSASSLNEGVVLESGQGLIGAGIASPIHFRMSAVDSVVVLAPGGMPNLTRTTAGSTVTLAQNNVIRGLAIDHTDGTAIQGSSFASLVINDVSVEPTGPALDLSSGTVNARFITLSAINSKTGGILLNNVNGSVVVDGLGPISIVAPGGPAISVSGGVRLSYGGDVTQGTNFPLLAVSNHADSITLGGALTASSGTGMQFSNADGTYAFNGAVNLAGGDAGVDVIGTSDGSFVFANAAISNPSGGPALNVLGGTPGLFYRGSITHNTGRAVVVDGITADSVVLRAAITSGTGAAPTGLGILVQNVTGGLVGLDSVKSLVTGANPAVTLNNAAGTVRLGHSLEITTTTGAGFTASGAGTVGVTGTNSVSTGTGVPVTLTSVNTGTAGVSFSSISTSAGAANGIVLNGISGAGFQGTGGTISGTTGPAVLLTNTNAADSVSLRGMTVSRSGGTGAVISGTNFGKLHALNTSVTATGGPGALALTTGTMAGTYSTVSSNASTGSGVSLTGVNGTFNASGGSINTAGAAAFLVSGGNVGGTISGTVGQASAIPLLSVTNAHSGAITFAGNVTATNGNGLQFDNADGSYIFTATVTLNGGDAGIDVTNGSGGTFTFPTTANIVSPSTGNLVSILNSAPTFTYSGAFTKANNNVTGIFVSGNTGGSVTFNGTGTKSISSGTAAAVNLTNNTGSTITFSGGGLNITSGTGAGFAATGGGTVQVTDNVNVISSSGGVALNVQNTTIGASGLRFQSIGATGGANGIVLNSTGTGVLTIVGNGGSCTVATPTCTGGHIASTTGAGVSLTAAQAVFNRLRVQGAQSHGITVTGSSNLTLNSSYLQSNGNGDEENGLNLLNVAGTVLVDASSFNGAAENLIRVDNNNANLTFTVQNASSFEFPNPEPSAFRNSAILITPKGSSAVTAVVTNSTFRNIPNYSFQFAPDASVTGIGTATFTNNTLSADAGLNVTCASNAQCRVGHIGVGGTGGTTNFVATGNNFNRVNGDGVFILGANQSSTLRMRIDNNTISNALDDAFVVGLGQSARVIAQFNGNTISNIGADVLEVASGEVNAGFGAGAASDMDLVFTNNSMNTVGTNSSLAATGGPGVFRFGDSDQLLCLAFTGNSMSGPLPTTGLKVYLDGNFGAIGGSMTYEGAGAGALTDAKIQADNPGMSLAPANTVISAVNLSNGATCQRPGI